MWAALVLLFVAVTAPWHDVSWHGGSWPWFPRVPWLFIGIVALVVWGRARHRGHHGAPPA